MTNQFVGEWSSVLGKNSEKNIQMGDKEPASDREVNVFHADAINPPQTGFTNGNHIEFDIPLNTGKTRHYQGDITILDPSVNPPVARINGTFSESSSDQPRIQGTLQGGDDDWTANRPPTF
jgi:hypothetical protein